jgi:hypothetical protein
LDRLIRFEIETVLVTLGLVLREKQVGFVFGFLFRIVVLATPFGHVLDDEARRDPQHVEARVYYDEAQGLKNHGDDEKNGHDYEQHDNAGGQHFESRGVMDGLHVLPSQLGSGGDVKGHAASAHEQQEH